MSKQENEQKVIAKDKPQSEPAKKPESKSPQNATTQTTTPQTPNNDEAITAVAKRIASSIPTGRFFLDPTIFKYAI